MALVIYERSILSFGPLNIEAGAIEKMLVQHNRQVKLYLNADSRYAIETCN